MRTHSFLEWRKGVLMLEFVLYESWQFMLYLYCISFFLKNFFDYEKIDVRIQILKRGKLTPIRPPLKRCNDDFRSKIDLQVAPYLDIFDFTIEHLISKSK